MFVAGSPAPLDKPYSYGGYASGDGKAWVLGYDEAERGLVLVQRAEQAASRIPLKPNFRIGNFVYGSQLLWDQVLVRGVTPDNERRLFALPVFQPDAGSFEVLSSSALAHLGRPWHDRDAGDGRLLDCRHEALSRLVHLGGLHPHRAQG